MIPTDLRYTDQHEWIRIQGGMGVVGITDHAQQALGEVTFVELPAVGKKLSAGAEICAIESAKAAASIYAPMSGKVVEVNAALAGDPSPVNSDPYGAGWICKIELSAAAEAAALMDAGQYEKFLQAGGR
jgi:glycine cleavage system H protein